jgi:hypothetical protein
VGVHDVHIVIMSFFEIVVVPMVVLNVLGSILELGVSIDALASGTQR